MLETLEAMIAAWDAEHVGVRLSPSSYLYGMADSDPHSTFSYLAISALRLAYVCLLEPNAKDAERGVQVEHVVDTFRAVVTIPLVVNTGFDEVAGLLYIEAPVMLGEVLRRVFAYTPEAKSQGSMWWWIVPLAPGVPERLIVGIERAFLGWFYERDHVVNHAAISEAVVYEYLRTFAGTEGRARQRGHLSCSLRQHRADRETAGAENPHPGCGAWRRERARRQRRRDGRDGCRARRGAYADRLRRLHA
jgi:hypothetical protein